MAAISHILCPIDFSETSEAALLYAIDLADKLGAEVTVLKVCETPMYVFPEGAAIPLHDASALFLEGSQKKLDEIIKKYGAGSVTLHSKVCEGLPHAEINRAAEALGAGLIVIGTHGRSGVSRVLMGSVAERVLRTATVPVLTVRGNYAGFDGSEATG